MLPRPRRHWSARYVFDRIRLAGYQLGNPDHPWLTADMVRFLDAWLDPTDSMVEFGSGRSTLWFSKRVERLVSVEHHADWHQQISQRLRDQSDSSGVSYLLAAPDAYVGAASDALGDRTVDIVLVDGPNRDACAAWGVERLRPGGLLVLDDAHRYLPITTRAPSALGEDRPLRSDTWTSFWERVSGMRRIHTTNGVKDCIAFVVS